MNRGRIGAVVFVLLLVGVIVGSLQFSGAGRPYDLASNEENGYLALRMLVEESGADVRSVDFAEVVSGQVDERAVVFIPVASGATFDQRDELVGFLESGGTVVLGTPLEDIGPPALDTETGSGGFGGFFEFDGRPGVCDLPELGSAGPISVPFNAREFDATSVASCYGDGNRALIVSDEIGAGRVVYLASPDLFTNVTLGAPTESEPKPSAPPGNGYVATQLLGSGDSVAVVTSGLRSDSVGTRQWTEFVGPARWAAIFQLLAACCWYAWYRGRRHGGVVTEPLPVSIDGSSYVGAVGNLLRRQGNAARAADTLRRHRWRSLERDLGLPAGTPIELIVAAVAARTGRTADEVAAVLVTAPIADDDQLRLLAAQLDQLHQETLHVRAPIPA